MVSDRQNSLLTKRNRQFLRNELEEEIEQASSNKTRLRIRKRVVNGLLDFWILNEHLDEDDIDLIFNPRRGKDVLTDHTSDFPYHRYTVLHDQVRSGGFPSEESQSESPTDGTPSKATTVFESALIDAIAFFWKGVQQLPGVDFEHVVQEGITKATKENGKTANVQIELEDLDIQLLLEKVDSGEISSEELKILLQQGPEAFEDSLLQETSDEEPDSNRKKPDTPEWMEERYDDTS